MKKTLAIITILLILSLIGAGLYYYLYFYSKNPKLNLPNNTGSTNSGFSPFDNSNSGNKTSSTSTQSSNIATSTNTKTTDSEYKNPKLRQISTTPIAGMTASSTASTSIVRFMDRGTGHIFEARNTSSEIKTLSNTTLPKIYEMFGNKNGNNFIVQYLKNDTDTITNFYTELRSTGTTTFQTPSELKGTYLSPDVQQVVVSPNGDRVFTWNIENGRGVGYISSFNEKTKVKIIDTPLTQVIIDWPETNTVTLTTKASAVASGYIYSIDIKSGAMKTVLGGYKGLTGKISRDNSKLLYSARTSNNFITSLINTKNGSALDIIFKTLSDKCVWSTLRKDELYCAVPTEIPDAIYPDDWYKGSVSFVDQIWHMNVTTGQVHLLANPLKLSDALVDATKLSLDPKENTLYFINKRDLTLWALDLNQ